MTPNQALRRIAYGSRRADMLGIAERAQSMASEADKAKREIAVFTRFVEVSGIPVDVGTVEKRVPPEPDLLCSHQSDGLVAFELVELCDPNLAKVFADPFRPGSEYIRTSDPSGWIVRSKLRKSYETSHPIELLCYTDGRVITPADVIIPTIQPYLNSFAHVFRRAWLLCDSEVWVVWE
jgi:hypothetical protein